MLIPPSERKFILASSDHHLGGIRTNTLKVASSMRASICDNPDIAKCKAIFLTGDLFDRTMEMSDPYVNDVTSLMLDIARTCIRYDIELFLLSGTPSHDMGQPNFVANLYKEVFGDKLKFHFGDTLKIIRDTVVGDVLFVPDEYRPNPDDTWLEVKQLLAEHGIEKVDYALMHGFFSFQVPAEYGVPFHKEERYRSIVRRTIIIGHDHTFKSFYNIHVPGSIERHRHGEEGPKGWLMIEIKEKRDQVMFVENLAAKIYRTLDMTNKLLTEVESILKEVCESLPSDSFIRLKGKSDDPVATGYRELIKPYPSINFETKFEREKLKADKVAGTKESLIETVTISKANFKELTIARIKDPEKISYCEELIDEFIANNK